MSVNNVTIRSAVVGNGHPVPGKPVRLDSSFEVKPARADELVLRTFDSESLSRTNVPARAAESTYTRSELITDGTMGEGCACRTGYSERTLTISDDSGTTSTFELSSKDAYFVLDTSQQRFGKSGADMSTVSHAVEETRTQKTASFTQKTVSAGISAGASVKTGSVEAEIKGAAVFAAKSSDYKYSSASETRGMIVGKNGAVSRYAEISRGSTQIHTGRAMLLAEAFGKAKIPFKINFLA